MSAELIDIKVKRTWRRPGMTVRLSFVRRFICKEDEWYIHRLWFASKCDARIVRDTLRQAAEQIEHELEVPKEKEKR